MDREERVVAECIHGNQIIQAKVFANAGFRELAMDAFKKVTLLIVQTG
jgi:hypothetical protein